MADLRRASCGSITTKLRGDKGAGVAGKNRFSIMSETQLATLARLEQRLDTLKERL
jgi:hypothetical protein